MWLEAGVCSGAGPGIVRCGRCHAGADGIALHVLHRRDEMSVVELLRTVSALPDVSRALQVPIEHPGVLRLKDAHGARHARAIPWTQNEVHMVGHEAVAEWLDVVARQVHSREAEVEMPIVVGEKRRLPVAAALPDVQRNAGPDASMGSSHRAMLRCDHDCREVGVTVHEPNQGFH